MYEPFVLQCVMRPQYGHLQQAYEAYRRDSSPCKRGITNQCAVRMSIALGRAGFDISGFQPSNRIHNGGRTCQTEDMPHLVAALEVANFLTTSMSSPTIIREATRGGGCAAAHAQIQGQKGILYFNNCFTRAGSTVQTGDHIDLFNGQQYYNQILRPRAGGNESTIGNLFGSSDAIWFWQLA